MIEQNLAQLRARYNNVQRYHNLLETSLTELERAYIGNRLLEEQLAIKALSSALPPEAMSRADQ